MSKPKFPMVVRRGHSLVKIYRTPSNGCEQFTLSYKLGNKRVRRTFSDATRAITEAEVIATKLSTGELSVLSLTSGDRLAYIRAIEALGPTGVPLELAAIQFAEAHKQLAGATLLEAVQFFNAHHPRGLPQKTVAEVVAELVAAKERDGMSPVYLKDLRNRLAHFGRTFSGRLIDVTAARVEDFLRELSLSGRSRNNFRRVIGTLFYFAESRGYLPKGDGRIESVALAKEDSSEIEIFSPEELRALLANAGSDTLPFLLVSAFAGLRHAEVSRLDWSEVRLEDGFIEVKARKSKTASRRLVPITENLRRWLLLHRRPSGYLCSHANMPNQIRRLANRSKVEWKKNALRHSFISYRVAALQNVAQVALEAGNSPQMIFRHYRELVRPKEAEDWFAIDPETVKVHTAAP